MGASFATREEAVAEAQRQILDGGEPACIYACTCGRQDLSTMAHKQRARVMEACAGCEKTVIGEAGRA